MGYYSDFSIKFSGPESEMEDFVNYVEGKWAEENDLEDVEVENGRFSVSCHKWYDHEIDMRTLSSLYLDFTFDVLIVGEENCPEKIDIRRYLVKNGHSTYFTPRIIWNEPTGNVALEGLH